LAYRPRRVRGVWFAYRLTRMIEQLIARTTAMSRTRKVTILASMLAAAGCAGMASTTRTGNIHDVKFEERMTPANLQVKPGDEVRWVNQRTTPVTVEFLAGALDAVTCETG